MMDDAAVVRPEGAARSLVLTMDVITPIVDDAHAFGAIAAANALSDVYAMGGRPEVALSFAGLPTDLLGEELAEQTLAGMSDACIRANCSIVGGHTMKDSEPKCGLAVVGSVSPDRIWSQRFAKAGDALVLTKPIGTGLVGQSVRKGSADAEAVEAAVAQMKQLNDVACSVGQDLEAHACTDITGFGLLGHLRHLAEASNARIELSSGDVPLLKGVVELAADGCVPGGSRRNLAYAEAVTTFDDGVGEPLRLVLADAQTSGGLLLVLPAARAQDAIARLTDRGVDHASIIGRIAEIGEPQIHVR
jgi:selenide,water dikinase